METVGSPPAEPELHLLTEWGDRNTTSRTQRAAVLSVLAHIVVIVWLILFPPTVTVRHVEFIPPVRRVITPLIEPLTELTQKDPQKGKITKEFNASQQEARPAIKIPARTPSVSKAPVKQASIPIPAPAKAAPSQPLPEPPKVEAVVKEPPVAPPPQIQPVEKPPEKPKIAFESPSAAPTQVPPGQSKIPTPNLSVTEAARQALRGNAGGGGMVVGDADAGGGGYSPGVNLPPAPGVPASQIQLLSDPMGVDFKPYLIRVLASVKQHWLAVIPESVRLGRRGKVAIQFSIDRTGGVPKLVIAAPSGADALDRAAVAGVSASVPFPPLPTEFKGDKIVLQFNFAYNSK